MSLQPLSELPKHDLTIKRALLSVSNKEGIVELAQALHEQGVELLSTGGTAKRIADADIPVTDVSEITGFQECMDGRVKTLHPHVHAGILARTSHQPDREELEKLGIEPIELVVVNLYPFSETIAEDRSLATATEYIDIGGPTMVRAAAKNFAHVAVLTAPSQYADVITQLKESGTVSFNTRFDLAREAFNHTASYDAHIAGYFNEESELETPPHVTIALPKSQELRYGENPHQKAAVYGRQADFIDCFHGKALSYNNFLDVDAALNLMGDFEDESPTCAIFKHTVPCGVGMGDGLTEAYQKAFSTDTVSPFGGIVIVNQALDLETAKAIDEIFTEIIIAPEYDADALELLTQKKNRRLVRTLRKMKRKGVASYRSIFGGLLQQDLDQEPVAQDAFKTVTDRKPTKQEWDDLLFAWRIVKHVKSNAIVYAGNRQTLGIGTGQTSRVDSSEIAVMKAKKEGLDLSNCAIASDAFFPFADGVEAAAKAGATSVIQPGGSIRDEEVIEMANAHGMAMVFTGKRHFKH